MSEKEKQSVQSVPGDFKVKATHTRIGLILFGTVTPEQEKVRGYCFSVYT